MPIQEQNIVNILRGLPGVGKSHFAKRIVKDSEYTAIILSGDDFFVKQGVYSFDKDLIEEAHKSTFEQFKAAVGKGIPYIIVDNTNIKSFHYRHYLDFAQRHNYLVVITIIPANDFSDRELEERNIHGFSRNTIRKMRAEFEWKFEG